MFLHDFTRKETNFYYDRNFCHKSRKWVEKRANVLIKNEDPAIYLPEVLEKKGEENFRKHCIPTDKRLWNIDKYPEFIAERRKLLTDMINSYLKELD